MENHNFDTLKSLITLVEKRIKKITIDIADSKVEIEKTDEFDVLIGLIEEDSLCFADAEFNKSLEVLLGETPIEDKELLNNVLDTIEYIKFVASSIQDNKFSSFSEDEKNQINEIIKALKIFKQISITSKAEEQNKFTNSNSELNQCVALYDKLRKGKEGNIHLNKDLPYLLSLIKDESPQFKKDVLELVRYLTKFIHENILSQIENNSLKVAYKSDSEDAVQEEIDEELLRELFTKYDYDFDCFTNKHKKSLATKCTYERLKIILEILTSYKEYSFIKGYQNNDEKTLFLIFRYASKETLEYLVTDANLRNVSLSNIFRVNGVYKKVTRLVNPNQEQLPGPGTGPQDDDYLNGSYEYYKANAKLFENLSVYYKNTYGIEIDFYYQILLKSPDVFTHSPEIIEKNIQHMKEYNLELTTRIGSKDLEPNAPTALTSGQFLRLTDILIENDLYDYVREYPSVVKDEPLVKIILFEQRNNNLQMNSRGQIRYIRHNRNKYNESLVNSVINRNNLANISKGLIIPSDFLEMLDDIEGYKKVVTLKEPTIEKLDYEIKTGEICYTIQGVKVSRLKFIRVWNAILRSGMYSCNDYHQLLLFALTYDSIYSDEALKKIHDYVYQPGIGGVTDGRNKSI